MEKRCVHIYTGSGKGKTTAAVGLAARALGSGLRVVFLQLLKNGQSGEVASLQKLGAEVVSPPRGKFLWDMDNAERDACREQQQETLAHARIIAKDFDLMVLDEVISAADSGMLPEEDLVAFLIEKPKELEVVMTGRGDCDALKPFADYYTEMRLIAHPFESQGLNARRGIEF